MKITHHATFLVSGQYGCILFATMPEDDTDLTEMMDEGNLWGTDFVQLTESAFYFSLHSDAIHKPVSIYFASETNPERQPDRKSTGKFTSKGEFVYLENIGMTMFADNGTRFYLPAGQYRIECHSWNLQAAKDHFSPYVNTAFDDVRREIFFIAT